VSGAVAVPPLVVLPGGVPPLPLVVLVSGAAAAVVSGARGEVALVVSPAERDNPGFSQAIAKKRMAMKLTEAPKHLIIYTSNQQVHPGRSS